MKHIALTLALVAGLVSGCASGNTEAQKKIAAKNSVRLNDPPIQSSSTNSPTNAIQTETKNSVAAIPDTSLTGKVLTFNSAGRFVVLDFPVGKMPALDATMPVYRAGKKIGEVKITGPARDKSTVADLTSGEAAKGDEVRER
jgi:hypothetical protein